MASSSRQLTSVYTPVKPRQKNSKATSFSNTLIHYCLKKNVFVCTSKAYMFPLQSDDIFRSDTRCHLLSCKSFACTTPVPPHACSCRIPPISASNCKNIRSVKTSIVILIVRKVVTLIESVNLHTLL